MALGKELEKVLLSQQHLLQVLVVVQTQVPEMELKQEQELQVWQVQEVILVKCVLADCSYSSSRSRIVVCVPVPYWLDAPLHCENLHSEAAQENRGNEDT